MSELKKYLNKVFKIKYSVFSGKNMSIVMCERLQVCLLNIVLILTNIVHFKITPNYFFIFFSKSFHL